MDEPRSQVLEYGTEDPQYGPGLRGWINRHPRTMWTATAIMIAVALGYIIAVATVQTGPPPWPPKPSPVPRGMAYYSDDNGATWFLAPESLTLTTIRDGRTAYRCHVYTCDGQTQFAAYLERYAGDKAASIESASSEIRQLISSGRSPATQQAREWVKLVQEAREQREAKALPGGNWVKRSTTTEPAGPAVPCPHGGQHVPWEVLAPHPQDDYQ